VNPISFAAVPVVGKTVFRPLAWSTLAIQKRGEVISSPPIVVAVVKVVFEVLSLTQPYGYYRYRNGRK
jgi:hypothetical protein